MRSIRTYALVGTILTAWITFAVLAIVDYHTTRRLLVYHFDDELRTHAGALVSLVHRTGSSLTLEFDEAALPFYRSSPKADYFEIRDMTGTVMRRSESLGDHDLTIGWGTPEAPRIADTTLPDGRPGRAIGVRYVHGNEEVRVTVAESRTPLDHALVRLVKSSLFTAAGLALALALVLYVVLRRGFRPLAELSARVERLDVATLPVSVGMGRMPREIAPVAARLDELLARVRMLIERERRVTGNIAHELMTPVAELRTLTDVALRFPDDVDYLRRATAATNTIAIRVQAMAEKVLQLATAQSRSDAAPPTPTDVAALLRESVALATERAARRSVTFDMTAPATAVVPTDPVALRVVLDNLAQNAADHAPSGSAVDVRLEDGAAFTLAFRNRAPDLVRADLPRLTEPYWRKDESRSWRGVVHAGIGLTLARELTERLGGALDLDLTGDELTITLTLRATPATTAIAPPSTAAGASANPPRRSTA